MSWNTDRPSSSTILAFSGESTYLNVFGNGDPTVTDWEPGSDIFDPNHQMIQDLELGADRVNSNHQKTRDKIIAALKLLTFREEHALVQFWSPHEVGKRQLLTTIDQPFGVGVNDHGLSSYRRDSEERSFVVDKDLEKEDSSPAARVFQRGLPEWTWDIDNYSPNHFPQQACALRNNLRGYLALPVFYSTTGSCVGVLELLTSSKYKSYAYEVQQLHRALKTQNLTTLQGGLLAFSALNIPNESRQKDYSTIYGFLKQMCEIHSLPLAQTWAVQHTSFVSHEKVIKKSCSSFDTRCVGKVCMSSADLPFHVQDESMWHFLEACSERHLDNSRGFVGKVLLSRGSCFCEDATKLGEEEYPLVHNARMNRLTSCFAIFLHSLEADDDYVLEFFLPPDIKDSAHVQNLVQTLKQKIEMASGFELGDTSDIQVVGPPTEIGKSVSIDPHTIQISSITTTNNNKMETVTSDSEAIMVNVANKTESSVNVSNPWQFKQIYPSDGFAQHDSTAAGSIIDNKMISYSNVCMHAGEKNKPLKPGRKRKIDSLTMETVAKHFGKAIDEAANSLGVSRSTLKRFCREHDIPSWPLPMRGKKAVHITNLKPSHKSQPKKNLQQPSNNRFGLAFVVFIMVRVKRWSCSIKSHGFSGKWWSCGMHTYLPSKSDSIYQAAEAVSGNKAKQTVAVNLDIKMVTVKATYKEDIIKFQLPTSSGLWELEHEVARRFKLGISPRLKYMDEENDMILLACDADLQHLFRELEVSRSKHFVAVAHSVCLAYVFVPFAFDKPAPEALEFCTTSNGSCIVIYRPLRPIALALAFSRIDSNIQKGVAGQVVVRLPAMFL